MHPENLKKSFFNKGAYIFVEGDEDANEIFLVEKGVVELTSDYKEIKQYKNLIREGEIFGLISSFCNRPRMSSAVAKTDCRILTFKKSKFIELIQRNPGIALKILRHFAEELRTYDEMMFALKMDEPEFSTNENKLFNLGKYYFKNRQYSFAAYILSRYMELFPNALYGEETQSMLQAVEKSGQKKSSGAVHKKIYKLYPDNQMIFCEYEPGSELFIIQNGKVKIVKVSDNHEIMLSILNPGDIFGELAIVSNKPRNASAISHGPTVLLPINKDSLMQLISRAPKIINRIFMAISQRIWFTYIRLESKLYNKPVTRIYAFLENKLLEQRISLQSTQSVTLNFGIDELPRMAGVTTSDQAETTNRILEDSNLTFSMGQTTIENPSTLSAKAKYYKSRDKISAKDEEKQKPGPEEEGLEEYSAPAPDIEEVESIDMHQGLEAVEDVRESSDDMDFDPENDNITIPSDEIPFD